MASFLAASDESAGSSQTGDFLVGGFVCPVTDWTDWVTPSWQQRVLDGPPQIPYLHMVDIRSDEWRRNHGLTLFEAEDRVDEALRVIGSSGSLFLVTSRLDEGHFRRRFRETKVVRPTKQPGVYRFDPDYICFLQFAARVLLYVSQSCQSAARIDFLVERKQGITAHLHEYHERLAEHLVEVGLPQLAPLVGDFIPAGKDRIELQAADVACWHIRRVRSDECSTIDRRRYGRLAQCRGFAHEWHKNTITAMSKRAKRDSVESPFKSKTKRSRST